MAPRTTPSVQKALRILELLADGEGDEHADVLAEIGGKPRRWRRGGRAAEESVDDGGIRDVEQQVALVDGQGRLR